MSIVKAINIKTGEETTLYAFMSEIEGVDSSAPPKQRFETRYYFDEEGTKEVNISDYETRPFTPYELFGIECREGWNSLIEPLFNWIEEYNGDKPLDDRIVVEQVKEKFGGLRFYCSPTPTELSNLISVAEEKSYATCEFCGSTEDIGHTTGWITTCCRKCAEEMKSASWVDGKTKEVFCFRKQNID